jgi:sulfate transport system ATP-binding protein
MIEGTRATVGQSLIATPEFSSAEKSGGIAYVRPHDLEIVASAAEAAVSATLTHAIKIGPSVRLELLRGDTSETIEVELTRERYTEIGPKIGQMLHLALRRAKVFAVTGASEL